MFGVIRGEDGIDSAALRTPWPNACGIACSPSGPPNGSSSLDGKVEDHHALEVRDDNQLYAFVLGVREIAVSAQRGVEGHDEPVREAVVEAFVALVDAVLHGEQPGNLANHATHLGEALVDLGRGDALLEDESSVVVDHGI